MISPKFGIHVGIVIGFFYQMQEEKEGVLRPGFAAITGYQTWKEILEWDIQHQCESPRLIFDDKIKDSTVVNYVNIDYGASLK